MHHQDSLILRSVWDWSAQFCDDDIQLFKNPFYKKPESSIHKMALPPNAILLPGMKPIPQKSQPQPEVM